MDSREQFEKWFSERFENLNVEPVIYAEFEKAKSNMKYGFMGCQAINDKLIGGDISLWLKDGETVIQRLERERNDSTGNLILFAEERLKVEKLEAKLKVAREALVTFDELIHHQYTGSRNAMSDLQHASNLTQKALKTIGEKRLCGIGFKNHMINLS